jgi:hypothetical protein
MILTSLFFWLAIIVLFVVFTIVLSLNSQKTTNEPITTTQSPANTATITPPIQKSDEQTITNPEYLVDPSSFIVDKQNVVSANFPANTPVWVESVVDEINLQVSYPIIVSGKKILKIERLWFGSLSNYSSISDNPVMETLRLQNRYPSDMASFINCIRQATIFYMKNNIEHQYVESKNTLSIYFSAFMGNGVTMNGNSLVPKIVDDGFGIGAAMGSNFNVNNYSQEMQTAILSNAGMWGMCLPK